jgi:hypothetical protein
MIQQKQIKSKEPIPEFKTIQEEAEFWDTHDVGEYLNDFNRIDIDVHLEKPKEENIVVRLQKPIKDRLEQIARRKGLNISSLTRMWIMEKLHSSR